MRRCSMQKALRGKQRLENDQRTFRRGIVTLEAAIALPVLIVLFVGVIDIGRMGYTSIALANACRCGAEYAACSRDSPLYQQEWESNLRAAVLRELAGIPRFQANRATISIDSTGALDQGRQHRVRVEYEYPFILRWPGRGSFIRMTDERVAVNHR